MFFNWITKEVTEKSLIMWNRRKCHLLGAYHFPAPVKEYYNPFTGGYY